MSKLLCRTKYTLPHWCTVSITCDRFYPNSPHLILDSSAHFNFGRISYGCWFIIFFFGRRSILHHIKRKSIDACVRLQIHRLHGLCHCYIYIFGWDLPWQCMRCNFFRWRCFANACSSIYRNAVEREGSINFQVVDINRCWYLMLFGDFSTNFILYFAPSHSLSISCTVILVHCASANIRFGQHFMLLLAYKYKYRCKIVT